MSDFDNEAVPLRSVTPLGVEPNDKPDVADEADLPTLTNVLVILKEAQDMCSNMNLIDLKHPRISVEQQVLAYQFALEVIITPLVDSVQDAVGDVEARLKQRSSR